MKLRENVKTLVADSPLKRSEIAKQCGITPESFTQLLNRHSDIGLPVLLHLSRVLQKTVPELIEDMETQQSA